MVRSQSERAAFMSLHESHIANLSLHVCVQDAQSGRKNKQNMIESLLARGGRAHRHRGSRTAANPDMLTARGLTKQWLRVFLSCACVRVFVCVVLNFEDKALLL